MRAYREIVRSESDGERVMQMLRELGGEVEVILVPLTDEPKKQKAIKKERITDKLAGCLREYVKSKEIVPIKEAREIAWDAVIREKYGSS